MSGSVACRLDDPIFIKACNELFERLGPKGTVTLMCGGAAKRLGDPNFVAEVTNLIETLGPERTATYMRNSVAKRLCEPNDELDSVEDYIKLMKGYVASKIENNKFRIELLVSQSR